MNIGRYFIRLAALAGLIVFSSGPSSGQWRKLPVSNTTWPGGRLLFLDSLGAPDIGYITAVDTLYKTTDRGSSWKAIPLPDSAWALWGDLVFKNKDVGCLSSGVTRPMAPDILRTTDGGESWVRPSVPNDIRARSLYYSEAAGFLAGGGGVGPYCYRSTDEGLTWIPFYWSYNDMRSGFAFVGPDSGILASSLYNVPDIPPFSGYYTLIKWICTNDGGRTWTDLPIDSSVYQPMGIWGTQTYFALTLSGHLLRTDDSWKTWRVIKYFPWPGVVYDRRRTSLWPTSGCIGGDRQNLVVQTGDGMYRSTDLGETWEYLCGPTSNDCQRSRFYVHRSTIFCQTYSQYYGLRQYWLLDLDSLQKRTDLQFNFEGGAKLRQAQLDEDVRLQTRVVDRNPDSVYLQLQFDTNQLAWKGIERLDNWSYDETVNSGNLIVRMRRIDSTGVIPVFTLHFKTVASVDSDNARIILTQSKVYNREVDAECLAQLGQTPDTLQVEVTGCRVGLLRDFMRTGSIFSFKGISPQPASARMDVTVERHVAGAVTADVVDMLGTTRLTAELHDGRNSLELSSLPAGTYYLRLSQAGHVVTRRVVIEH